MLFILILLLYLLIEQKPKKVTGSSKNYSAEATLRDKKSGTGGSAKFFQIDIGGGS
jgi:hypothetical protein